MHQNELAITRAKYHVDHLCLHAKVEFVGSNNVRVNTVLYCRGSAVNDSTAGHAVIAGQLNLRISARDVNVVFGGS